VGIALALVGCSAGQIAQTAGMEPAVNGGIGQAGSIAVRDVQLAYPEGGVFKKGEDAVVRGTIVNSGRSDDQLLQVTSSVGTAVVSGDRVLFAGKTLEFDQAGTSSSASVTATVTPTTTATSTPTSPTGSASGSVTTTGSASGSATATSGSASASSTPTTTSTTKPVTIGQVSIVLTDLSQDVQSGKTVEITFVFTSGQVTVTVPVATPTTPRQPPVEETP
jgi:copper(I)-binding protein